MPSLSCPSAKQLSLLVSGMLPEPPADEVATHVNNCETCARLLAVLPAQDELGLSMRRAARVPMVEGHTLRDELAKLPDKINTVSAAEDRTAAIERPRPRIEHELKLLLDAPQSDDELGRIGAYRVLKVLGRGGMGLVLLAEDSSLRRQVALKLMQSQLAADPEIVARFEREARATAAVRSDYVVSIFSVEKIQTNIGVLPCMAMEYLHGESLETRLKRGPLSVDEVLLFGVQIASGLAAVHAKTLVHRDIKPGNLWLEPIAGAEGTSLRAKLLDFGLAHTGLDATVLTQFGAIIGTPAYMSPEQASGKEVDVRSDLFSLGAVLYEMTTGQKPFQGPNTMAVLMALAGETPPTPITVNSAIPQQLSRLIMRLLEKSPAARPANAQEVLEKLRTIRKESRGPRRPQIRKQPSPMFRRGAFALAALGALGLIVSLSGVLIKINTPKGTLVIESDDDSVEVRVTKNGATIIDHTKDRMLQLAMGEYGIELVNKVNGLQLSAEKITISRDGQPPIRITREKPTADSSKVSANAVGVEALPVPMPGSRATTSFSGPSTKPDAQAAQFSWPLKDHVATIGDDSGYHWGAVWSVASNEDGSSFLSSGADGFWYRAGENETLRHVIDPLNPAHQVLFHDELGFLTLHKNGQVQQWTLGPEVQRSVVLTVPERTRRIEFSSDANHVAVWVCPQDEPYGFADDHWPIKDWPQPDFVCTTGSVTILKRMPDGKFAESFQLEGCRRPAISRDGKTWSVYRIDTKRLEHRSLMQAGCPVVAELPQDDPVTSLACLEDGRITGLTLSGMLCLWKINGTNWDRVWETKGSTDPRWGIEVARHKPLVACFNLDGFRCVDLNAANPDAPSATSTAGGIFHELRAHPKTAAFSGNGSRLTVGSLYGHVYRFEMAGPKLVENKTNFRMPQVRFFIGLSRFCFSQDGSRFLCRDGGKEGNVFTWKMGGSAPTTIVNAVGNGGAGRRIHAVDREGRTAIVAYDGPDEPFSVWKNMGPQPTVLNLKQYINASSAVLSPDGMTVALGSRIGEVFLVDLSAPESKELAQVRDLAGPVQNLGLSADRQRIVAIATSASNAKQVVLTSLAFEQGKLRETFSEQAKEVVAHDLTLDGRWLALAQADGRASVYEVGAESWKLHGSWKVTSAIQALSIAPDGKHVCTADQACVVRVCQTETGLMTNEWRMPGRVHATVFVGDKDQVLTYNDNMTAYVLKIAK